MNAKKIHNLKELTDLKIGDKIDIIPSNFPDKKDQFFYGGININYRSYYFFQRNSNTSENIFKVYFCSDEVMKFENGALILTDYSVNHYSKKKLYKTITDFQKAKTISELEAKLKE